MAKVRTISTRLAIEGEAQYKQAVSVINAELRNHKSALDLVQSQYRTNANSLEALQAKQKKLTDLQAIQTQKVNELNTIYQKGQAAVKVYKTRKEELTKKIEENEAALEALKNTEGDTTEEQKRLTEETKKLKQELAEVESNLSKAEIKTNNWGASHNRAQKELEDTKNELKLTEKYIQEADQSIDKCATSIDKFGKETKNAGDAVDILGSALSSAGIAAALKQMADAMVSCVQASIEFESAMTGVEKTTDLTDKELAQMADAFKDLSGVIPMTAAELAAIAENAGQLGIEKDNIVGFTKVMADLGVATNLSGEQAAQAIAKIANITGMAQTDFDRFGSSVVALGNNFATTESDIVMMSNRLASAGTMAGLTETEILALATAMSSVGIEAEAGGTAMTQTLGAIEKAVASGGEKLEQFARVAGVSSDEFSRKWKTSPVEAIQLFIRGLGNLEKQGENATVVLDEMGLSGIRQSNMLKSLSLASDNVAAAVDLSNKAWAENSALTREAELRYGTTESKLKLLDNSLNRLKITIGDQLNPALNGLIDAGTNVLDWITDFAQENEWLVPVLTGVSVAVGVLATAMVFLSTTVQTKVIPAIIAMGKALMANPVALVIAGVAALTTALISLSASLFQADEESQKLAASTKALAEEMESAAEAAEKADVALATQEKTTDTLIGRLEKLASKTNRTRAEQLLLEGTTAELAELYPEINEYLSENTDELRKNIPAIKDRTEALIAEQKVQQKRDRIIELETAQARAEEQLAVNEAKRQRILDGLTDEQKKHLAGLESTNRETVAFHASAVMLDDELAEAASSLNELNEADAALRAELEDTNEELTIRNEWLATSAEMLEKYGITMEEYNALTADMTETQREQYDMMLEMQAGVDESIDAQKQALETIAAAHEAAWWAARDSIDSQIGKWEEMDNKTTISAKKVINALQSQITFMANYTDNMTSLTDRNINELARLSGMSVSETKKGMDGFVASLSDGSVESAQILAGLATASDEEIANIVLSMKGVEEGKDAWATSVTGMDESTKAALDSITAKLDALEQDMDKYDEAARAARHTADGYIETLRKKIPAMRQMGEKLGRAVTNGYNSAAKVKSPSQVAMKSAEDTVAGYLVGYEKKINDMEKAGEKLARATSNSYTETMKEIALYSRPQNVLVLPTAANNATASQAPSKSVVYNFNSPKALSMREIRLEMIATQQRERLMEV